MSTIMNNIFNGESIKRPQLSFYKKSLTAGEHKSKPKMQEFNLLPDDTCSKQVLPKIISFSEFRFKTLQTRLVWEAHYKYLNQRYGIGLEAAYMNKKMILEGLESVKKDIQSRISNNRDPKNFYNGRGKKPMTDFPFLN